MGCANYKTFVVGNLIRFVLLFCCFPLGSIGANEASESDVERIIKIDYRIDAEPVTLTTEQLNILRNQRAIRVGDKLSRYAIQQSLKTLYATQRYAQIQVYTQQTPAGIVLTYQLIPFARIEEIVIIGVPQTEFRRAINQVLRTKPKGTYVPEIVETDISRIEQVCQDYGYFNAKVTVSDIPARVVTQQAEETRSPTVTLIYQITLAEASTIRKLEFLGNSAIPTYRLNAACSFSKHSPVYNKSAVDIDAGALKALYEENRYLTTTVVPTFSHETGVLQFQINEGKQVQFKFVSDVGEVPLSHQDTFRKDIVSLINTSNTAVWKRRIKSYFKAQGYHDTTVDEEVVEASEVQLVINPGIRYIVTSISFLGNRAFSDTKLLREMTMKPIQGFLQNLQAHIATVLFQREQRHFFYEQKLAMDIDRLRLLYGRAGYPKTSIRATLDKKLSSRRNIGEIEIRIVIVEEQKEMIHRCVINGNQVLDTATLLRRLQSELPLPQPNTSLKRNAYQDAVLKAYQELGYIDAVVNNTYLPQTETPIFQMSGNFSELLADGKIPLKIRDTFETHNLALEDIFIAANIGNRWSLQDFDGNPRYTFIQEAEHIKVFEHGVLYLTVVKEGKQVAFGKFYFEGDTEVVKQHVLDREVVHLEGTIWTSEKLNRARQNLYSLGVFRGVQAERLRIEQIIPQNTARNRKKENPIDSLKSDSVLIKLEKQLPRTYSLSGGYSSAVGARLTGEVADSNFLFKRNIRGRLRGRLGWRDELGYLFDATLTEPWLIERTRGSLQLSGRRLEIDDYVRALQGSFILSRQLFEANYVNLRYNYKHLSQPVPTSVQDATTVSSLRFSWTYDSRVRYLNPTAGMLNAITLEYAGGFLQGETGFIKTTTDTRHYQKLGGIVLATALRLGVTTGLHSNRRAELISFERFWAGGSTTVRGYAERSLGPEDITGIHRGDVQFIFNTELRFPIYSVVRGAIFFDTGNVWDSLEDIDTVEPLPSSVGAGIYLDLGALTGGIGYAIPFVSVPTADTNRIHFRLGGTF